MPLEAEEKGLTREVKWVFFDESPSSEKVTNPERVLEDIDRVVSGESSNVRSLVLRDPVTFKAGELRHHINLWERILEGYRQKTDVLEWISSGVNIRKFMKPFKGVFKNVAYDSPSPPKKVFKNHPSASRSQALFQILSLNVLNLALFACGEGLARFHPHGWYFLSRSSLRNPDFVSTLGS